MLTGGQGYVFGTLFGVMVLGVTQVLIQFNGSLSSWWTRIVIGLLMLAFIGVQSLIAQRKGATRQAQSAAAQKSARRRRLALVFAGAAVLVVVLAVSFVPSLIGAGSVAPTESNLCEIPPFREAEAASLMQAGAVIVYHRTAGTRCVDELYAVFPDGRVVANDGRQEIESRVDPVEIEKILKTVTEEYGWFTNNMYSTWHNPCKTCYAHYLTISANGQEKTVTAVDGGVDMQPEYGYTLSILRPILPKFTPAP
jgi:hypothetical protein